ncbi:hypothetical protein LF817_14530 [Halobacillus sp. A1]|uniref:hypothetical protein n=1 Tax=Halobacillus sp. A1 TaxID=2880262 RepID=UPI0020A63416|nr:hypothetical protein [Halobacillus sp. A1]MCP3032541.1 hypothetical protein [Halobacillus sp. A1]
MKILEYGSLVAAIVLILMYFMLQESFLVVIALAGGVSFSALRHLRRYKKYDYGKGPILQQPTGKRYDFNRDRNDMDFEDEPFDAGEHDD